MEPNKPQRRPPHLPPITKELVFQIADGLKAAKKRVTNESVRAALQGGSLLTIAPLVREWHQNEDERFRLSLEEIPDGVEEASVLAAKAIWKIASDLASQQLKELGKKMQEMEAEHLQQVQAYEQEIANLEAERETLIGEREQSKATILERNGELAAVEEKLTETTQALTLATLRGQDLERDRLKLEAELKSAREDAAAHASACMKAEAKLEIESVSRERAEKQLEKAHDQVQKTLDQLQSMASELATIQKTLASEQAKNRASATQILQLQEQLEVERASTEKAKEEYASASAKATSFEISATVNEAKADSLAEQVNQLKAQMESEREASQKNQADLRSALESITKVQTQVATPATKPTAKGKAGAQSQL